MRVLGVDPGARSTGYAVIDTNGYAMPTLLRWAVLDRPKDGTPLEAVPREYLVDVVAAAADAIRETDAELLSVEGIRKPNPHVNRRNGNAIIDPAGLLGTATILGALHGRLWSVPVVIVPPGQNGTYLPLNRYPDPIGTTGKGNDRKRHARSAYDVAHQGANLHRRERNTRR